MSGAINIKKNRILKPETHPQGYKRVVLSKNGAKKHFFNHRLVGLAFVPNPENKPEINHKNGIKDDNRIENLEWATSKENSQHDFNINRRKPTWGNVKLDWDKVDEIRRLRKTGNYTLKQIGNKFDVCFQTIGYIVNNKIWKEENR